MDDNKLVEAGRQIVAGFQLRAVDLVGFTHTTWCHHNATKEAAVAECRRFFAEERGYTDHQALTMEECHAELPPEERERGRAGREALGRLRDSFAGGEKLNPEDVTACSGETHELFVGHIRRLALVGMSAAGVHPATIFATFTAGVIATRTNWRRLHPKSKRDYLEALKQYEALSVAGKNGWKIKFEAFRSHDWDPTQFDSPVFADIYRGAIGGPIMPPLTGRSGPGSVVSR